MCDHNEKEVNESEVDDLDVDKAEVDESEDISSEVNEAVRKYNSLGRKLTYADYASWDDDNRYELIDGVAYFISAPSVAHQSILTEITRQLANYLFGKTCRVFASTFDICLFGKGDEDTTVVQPDVLVICDRTKIENGRYCNGAPDLVVEILSLSSSKRDRFIKLKKYLQAGVREYWIVDPDHKSITVHILENDKYVIYAYDENDVLPVNILDDCDIILSYVFSDL